MSGDCKPTIVRGANGVQRLQPCPEECKPRIVIGPSGGQKLVPCPTRQCTPRIIRAADGSQRLDPCPTSPPPPTPKITRRRPDLNAIVTTAQANGSLTSNEVGQIWNALQTDSTDHMRIYQQFVARFSTGSIQLTPAASRFIFDMGSFISQDQTNSPLAAITRPSSATPTYLAATLDAYDDYKIFRSVALVSTGGSVSDHYHIDGGPLTYSVKLLHEPAIYPFKAIPSSKSLSVNLNANQHYVSNRAESSALNDLRHLAQTAATEEGWLQVVVLPTQGGSPQSYFYEVGTKEQTGQVSMSDALLHQAMQHADKLGHIQSAKLFHIHPRRGLEGKGYNFPPSDADLVALHLHNARLQQDWQGVTLESGIVSDKRLWNLSLTQQGISASTQVIKQESTATLRRMRSAQSTAEIAASYNQGYYKLTYQDL